MLFGILFCAIAIVLSYIESLIPLYLGVPGAKLGLANVVTLTLLLCFGLKEAFIVMFLRILIVSMTFTISICFYIVYQEDCFL